LFRRYLRTPFSGEGAASLNSELRPAIGISCRFNWETSYYNLRIGYPDAILASGGTPILLPLLPNREYIDSVVEKLDGLCLSGSDSDVDPLRYGREPILDCGINVPRRDETDLMLLEAAEKRGLPVLCICFGIQVLNVYRGGTLIQDIPSQTKDPIRHRQGDIQERHQHSISITEDSLLARLAGGTRAAVNSHHHQAVENVGRDLVPVAWAPDGVIEAVENTRSGQFILGVQWHPEIGWQNDSLSRAIFDHFIGVARERMFAQLEGRTTARV